MKSFDYVIVGGGIVGLTIARSLVRKGARNIAIFEKEKILGMHSSGRNSGVLHSGVYYAAESLKAKFCAQGSKLMRDYAQEHQINLKKTGKVIVAPSQDQVKMIDFLYDRSTSNGVKLEKISPTELKKIEPEAHTFDCALYSPDTAVIDSKGVLSSLERELRSWEVALHLGEAVVDIDAGARSLSTTKDIYSYGHIVNCAGLHADRIAHLMGVGLKYKIIPFKGLYKKIDAKSASRFRGSIYPVPDLRFPFLGVHITRTADDQVVVGPTAIPAFGRENYGIFSGITPSELGPISLGLAKMFLKNRDNFRSYVLCELEKYSSTGFWKAAQALAPSLRKEELKPSQKVGIRAQLVDTEEMKLIMDFQVANAPHSTHILNAISPAFTCSFAFAEWLINEKMAL